VRVSVGDVRLYFEVFGQQHSVSPDAASITRRPTLIALHGGPGGDGTKLRFLLPTLADLAQVVVPDQRGHGRSDWATPETWNLNQWAADVRDFADALGIERPIVLGESFGGFVAQQYAGLYPDHPAALILVSCGPRFATEEEVAAHVRGSHSAEVAAVTQRRPGAEEEGQAMDEWKQVVAPHLAVHRDATFDRLEALRMTRMEVNRHFEPEGFRMDLRPLLAHVRCPTLVLVGEHDILVPPPLREELRQALPSGLGRVEVVPDASHQVLTDNPSVAWPLIRTFLADSGGAG
jgi:pimeloyl-ACP methyl ester carboxylesterase